MVIYPFGSPFLSLLKWINYPMLVPILKKTIYLTGLSLTIYLYLYLSLYLSDKTTPYH